MRSKNLLFSVFVIFLLIGIVSAQSIAPPSSSENHGASGEISALQEFFSVLFSVTSGTCTPSAGYVNCDTYEYSYGESTASFYMQTSNLEYDSENKLYYWKYKSNADDVYYYDKCFNSWTEFWNYANCDSRGCYNYKQHVSDIGQINILQGSGTYEGCPVLLGWEYDTASNGDWSWSSGARGWQPFSNRLQLTIKEEVCVENWDCTSWGTCINGVESRTCTDLNSCGSIIFKPLETRSCTVSGYCGDGTCSTTETVDNCIQDCNECGIGTDKCEGTIYYICDDTVLNVIGGNKWISQGEVGGKCGYVACNTEADTNCDGIVSRIELHTYSNNWINKQLSRDLLAEVINAYSDIQLIMPS